MNKIIHYDAFETVQKNLQNKITVLVGGCFDVFHYGHLVFLKKAKQLGDFLIIVLESDEFIKNRKKRQPIHTQQERAEILSALELVDLVVLLPYFSHDKQYEQLVQRIKPAIIAVTEGDMIVDKKKQQANMVSARLVIVCKLISGFSSSKIIHS